MSRLTSIAAGDDAKFWAVIPLLQRLVKAEAHLHLLGNVFIVPDASPPGGISLPIPAPGSSLVAGGKGVSGSSNTAWVSAYGPLGQIITGPPVVVAGARIVLIDEWKQDVIPEQLQPSACPCQGRHADDCPPPPPPLD